MQDRQTLYETPTKTKRPRRSNSNKGVHFGQGGDVNFDVEEITPCLRNQCDNSRRFEKEKKEHFLALTFDESQIHSP